MPDNSSPNTVAAARTPSAKDRQRFAELVGQWKEETAFSSSPGEASQHPAYREIVQMGDIAVPLLLAEIEARPDHWFTALQEITGADPVPPQARGRMKEMVAAWVTWGRSHGVHW